MKSIFDKTIPEELIERILLLDEISTAKWGRMNVYQMLKHCTLCEEMYLGKTKYERAFIGRIFGKLALRNLLRDDTPLKPNAPTSSAFRIKENIGNVPAEKEKWIALLGEYADYSNDNFSHWFFGKMTKEQVGYFVYKHADHHLRQFGV